MTEVINISDDYIKSKYFEIMEQSSFHEIAEDSKKLNRIRRKVYPEKKECKYSDYQKALTEDLFLKIYNETQNDRIKLAFKIMFYMGLRISEVVLIKKEDIGENWVLKINNVKCSREDKMIVPKRLRQDISEFIDKNNAAIKRNKNYIFFSNNPIQIRNHISKDWLRNHFREITLKLEINKIYDHAEKGNQKFKRKLYLYSTHSLRHGFAHMVYKKLENIEESKIKIDIIMKALRHKPKSIVHTLTYLNTSISEVYWVVEML